MCTVDIVRLAPVARRERRNRLDRGAEGFVVELRVGMQGVCAGRDFRRSAHDVPHQLIARLFEKSSGAIGVTLQSCGASRPTETVAGLVPW